MKRKLARILLIDDSEADNFIHARRIRKANVTDEIVIKENGREALTYLSTRNQGGTDYPQPELVFLDINMPVMNGWEFLDHYEQLAPEQKAGIVVTMLTTSSADTDRRRAEKYREIAAYEEKPLTQDKLLRIIREHFAEFL